MQPISNSYAQSTAFVHSIRTSMETNEIITVGEARNRNGKVAVRLSIYDYAEVFVSSSSVHSKFNP